MSTEDDKELRAKLGEPVEPQDLREDQSVPIYGDFSPNPHVTMVPVYGVPVLPEGEYGNHLPLLRHNPEFHIVIEEPVCAECNNLMEARILHATEEGKIPVFHCGCCKRVHKVTRPEFLNWMGCTKLCSPALQYVGRVDEGKVYRV